MEGINLNEITFGQFAVLSAGGTSSNGSNTYINGIPANSHMFTNSPVITNTNSRDVLAPQSVASQQVGQVSANVVYGGVLKGVTLEIGSNFKVDSTGNVTAYNLDVTQGSIVIGANFSVDDGGNLYAASAVLSGSMDITGGSITVGSNFFVSNTGNLTASNATITGNINSSTITDGSINIGNGTFTVNSSGVVNASSGTFSGTVNASSGTFSGSITASGTITGGTLDGTTIHLPNAGGFLTFNNTSGSPDAAIVEDTNNNFIIRCGSGGTIAFEDQSGSTIWGEVNSGGFNTSGGISVSGAISAGQTISAGNFSTGGNVSAGSLQANSVNTNGQTWAFADINCGAIGCSTISTNGNSITCGPIYGDYTNIYNGQVGGGILSSAIQADIILNTSNSQQIFANYTGAAAFGIDQGGDIACFSNMTQGANNGSNGYLTCNNFTNHGAKDSLEWTSKGTVGVSCVESTEVWYEDLGEGKIVNEECLIELDPLYLEVTEGDYHVILSAYGQSSYLYCERSDTSFMVKSDKDIPFSYKVIRHRRHYGHFRFHTWEDIDAVNNFIEHDINVRNIQKEFEEYKKNHPRPIPTFNP
jgi:hypothetical protein